MTSSSSLAALALLLLPAAGAAQLRPIDPTDWRIFDPDRVVTVEVGGDLVFRQPAPLAGITGTLVEAPAAFVSWNTGRIVVRAVIHPLRYLREESVWAPPLPGTDVLPPGWGRDAGDNALETLVRLAPGRPRPNDGTLLALRYGVRLPTHNDRRGFDRHKTDFYALLGGRLLRGGLSVGGEGGIGVFGTHEAGTDKVVPFVYTLEARWLHGLLEPSVALTGQTMSRPPRSNPDLSELRVGVRVGRKRWLQATYLHGLTRMSPGSGFLLLAGVALPQAPRP